MTSVRINGRSICSVPHLYCLIPACGGNEFTIWGPGYGNHMIVMTFIDTDSFPLEGIPYLHCCIATSRSYVFAIWGPCYCVYWTLMSRISVDKISDAIR